MKKPGRPLWNVKCSANASHSFDQFNESKPKPRCKRCGAEATVTHLAELQASIEQLVAAPKPKPKKSKPTTERRMEIEVSKVKVAKNRKARPEAVVALAESIDEIGLLNPIILDDDNNLIAGLHRLMAHKHLALKDPDFKVIEFRRSSLDTLGLELARIDENLCRNQMTALERAEALAERKDLWERMHPETKHGGDRKSKKAIKTKPLRLDPSFSADTAKKTGASERSVQQYTQVAKDLDPEAKMALRDIPAAQSPGISELVKLGRLGPEKQREIAQQVAKTGETVKAATRTLLRRDQVAQAKVYQAPPGEYPVIFTDYPWEYDDALDGSDAIRGGLGYPHMTIDEICKFPIPAAKDCALFVCVTNSHLIDPEAYAVVARSLKDRYGFVPKQIETWRKVTNDGTKERFGGGHVLRNNTEHIVRFERGNPVFNPVTLSTCFDAPRSSKHSEKPDQIFERIELLCPSGPKLEMFAREEQRPGWVTTGSELPPKRQGWVEQASTKAEETPFEKLPLSDPAFDPLFGGATIADKPKRKRKLIVDVPGEVA